MNTKKIKEYLLKKRTIKKTKIGFTLVELLAVIVILGILLLLAVPATQNVIKNARIETFKQYSVKVKNLVQQKLQEEEIIDKSLDSNTGCFIYNIKTDLGLADTGEYNGYIAIIDAPPRRREVQAEIKIAGTNTFDAMNAKNDFLISAPARDYYDYSYSNEEAYFLILWNKDYFVNEIYSDSEGVISSTVMTYKQFKNSEPGALLDSGNIIGAVQIVSDMVSARCSYDKTTNKDNTPDDQKETYIDGSYFYDFISDFVGRRYNNDLQFQSNKLEEFSVDTLSSPSSYSSLDKLKVYAPPISYESSNLFTFERYHGSKPDTRYDVSKPGSYYGVFMWVDEDSNKVYYYSEASHVYITDSSYIFESSLFKYIDLSEIDFSKTRNVENMFSGSGSLETVKFGNNTLSRVYNMSYMFNDCYSLRNIYVDNDWNLNNVSYSSGMFYSCESLPNFDYDNANDHTFATTDKYLTKS